MYCLWKDTRVWFTIIEPRAGICIPSFLVWHKLLLDGLGHGGEAKLRATTKVLFL